MYVYDCIKGFSIRGLHMSRVVCLTFRLVCAMVNVFLDKGFYLATWFGCATKVGFIFMMFL